MDIVKVNWSGGKDSTCALSLHLNKGHKVKAVCYIPMFTESIPLISRSHFKWIMKTKKHFEDEGAEIHIVTGMTYWDYVTRVTTRGKYKGKIFGFPSYITGHCNFRTYSKIKAIRECDVCDYDYEDIGIAYDEHKRKSQLTDKKRSILNELKITESQAQRYCYENGILSPHYTMGHRRDGCALCPHKKKDERFEWFQDYPEALPLLIELQNIVKEQRPDRPPLREYKYFIE